MADVVPPGSYPECEQAEQKLAVEVLGGKRVSFTNRKNSLVAMRTAVNTHESRLDKIEANMEVLLSRPF